MAPQNTGVDVHELRRRLYGSQDSPGETGDIPAMKADIAYIRGSVDDLAGFYRTVKRVVVVGASLSTMMTGIIAAAAAIGII